MKGGHSVYFVPFPELLTRSERDSSCRGVVAARPYARRVLLIGGEQRPQRVVIHDDSEDREEEHKGAQCPEPFGVIRRRMAGQITWLCLVFLVMRYRCGHASNRSSDGSSSES